MNIENYPKEAAYVIIGAGTAAHAACRAIRKNDQNAKVKKVLLIRINIISKFLCIFRSISYFFMIYSKNMAFFFKEICSVLKPAYSYIFLKSVCILSVCFTNYFGYALRHLDLNYW